MTPCTPCKPLWSLSGGAGTDKCERIKKKLNRSAR
jgi:hypothetical protein